MKKLLLFMAAGSFVVSSSAQEKIVPSSQVIQQNRFAEVKENKNVKHFSPSLFKTTATPFLTYDFAGGTSTSLPAGWTTGSTKPGAPGSVWKWADTGTTGNFSIGELNSSSAYNGWMVFDSDSIGSLYYPVITDFGGWLQSPMIDLSTHPYVNITFEQDFVRFADSCYIDVSIDGGTTWPATYEVNPNNTLSFNAGLADNPTITQIDISAVAGGQDSVSFRFRYQYGSTTNTEGGAFNWLVDDVVLSDADTVDIKSSGSGILMATGTGDTTSFGSIPLSLLGDTLIPITRITNVGATNQNNIQVDVDIFNGASSVFNDTKVVSSLPVNTYESRVTFSMANLKSAGLGSYTAAYSTNQGGDAIPTNNNDTLNFTISDSIYHRFGGFTQGGYYIHRPASTGNEISFQMGTLFEIVPGTKDTLTYVSAAFHPLTDPNTTVGVIVYKQQPSGTWSRIHVGQTKTLTTADITPSGGPISYAALPLDPTAPVIFDGGAAGANYAVMIASQNTAANDQIVVISAQKPGFPSNLIVGVTDTSKNALSANSFSGLGSARNFLDNAPLIRLHFKGTPPPVSTTDVTNVINVQEAYPNPAHTTITIPFTLSTASNVNVTITNTVGATIKTQALGKYNANQSGKAEIYIADLANGVYFYTVEANGNRITKRFVVNH